MHTIAKIIIIINKKKKIGKEYRINSSLLYLKYFDKNSIDFSTTCPKERSKIYRKNVASKGTIIPHKWRKWPWNFFRFFKSSTPLLHNVSSTRHRTSFSMSLFRKVNDRGMPGISSIENEITSGNKIFVLRGGRGKREEGKEKRERERKVWRSVKMTPGLPHSSCGARIAS